MKNLLWAFVYLVLFLEEHPWIIWGAMLAGAIWYFSYDGPSGGEMYLDGISQP